MKIVCSRCGQAVGIDDEPDGCRDPDCPMWRDIEEQEDGPRERDWFTGEKT